MQSAGVNQWLARYPIKSMRGEALPATMVTLQGVPEDRRMITLDPANAKASPEILR